MPKPAFDPSKPFTEEKPKFDPSVPYEDVSSKKEFGTFSPVRSAISGAAQGLTLGLADEIAGHGRAALDKLTGSDEPYLDLYRKYQKEQERYTTEAERQNPGTYMGSQIGSDVLASLTPVGAALNPTRGASMAANVGKMAGVGALYGAGRSTGDLSDNASANELTRDVVVGGALGGATQGLVQSLAKAASALAPDKLKRFAEKAAENATGATGKQSEKFADDAGRKLLDTGVVSFGDTPEKVAEKSLAKLQSTYDNMDPLLKRLDDEGAHITKDEILEKLNAKIASLKDRPSQSGVVKQLQAYAEDFAQGLDQIPLSVAESEKRAYQSQVNYMTDKITHDAKKAVANTLQTAVEEKASKLNPELGKLFKDAKETYKLFKPIQEAAEKRTATLKQSPWGGLLDTAAVMGGSTGAGYAYGGGDPGTAAAAGLAGLVGRRVLAPRASSSAAVAADALSKKLAAAPENLKAFSESLYRAVEAGVLPRSVAERMIDQATRGE